MYYLSLVMFLLIVFITSAGTAKTPYSYINKCCPIDYAVGKHKVCIKHSVTFTEKVYNKDIAYIGRFNDIFHIKPNKFADRNFFQNAQTLPPLPDNNFYVTDVSICFIYFLYIYRVQLKLRDFFIIRKEKPFIQHRFYSALYLLH